MYNGTYTYSILNSQVGSQVYVPSQSTGNLTVSGPTSSIQVPFVEYFTLNFTETGLVAGTLWNVTILNDTLPFQTITNMSNATSTDFLLPNGTYNFTVANSSAANLTYVPVPDFGQARVSGSTTLKCVSFTTNLSQYNPNESLYAPGFRHPLSGPPRISASEVPWNSNARIDGWGLTRQENVSWFVRGLRPLTSMVFVWQVIPSHHRGAIMVNLEVPAFWNVTIIPPSYNHTTVSLDVLNPNTCYRWTLTVSNHFDNQPNTATQHGRFCTLNGPPNGFAGWVLQSTPQVNRSLTNSVETAGVSGAEVFVEAECVGPHSTFVPTLFYPGTTQPDGFYNFTFPYTASSPTLSYFGASGCSDRYGVTFGASYVVGAQDQNPQSQAYWSVGSVAVSEPLSPVKDVVEIIILPDVTDTVQVALALIHTTVAGTTFNNIKCGFTYVVNGSGSWVNQSNYAGTIRIGNTTNVASQTWNSPGGWGVNNSLNVVYAMGSNFAEPLVGNVSATPYQLAPKPAQGVNTNPTNATDWVNLIQTPPSENLPPGWHEVFPNLGQGKNDPISESIFASGTYTSTTGSGYSFSFGVGYLGVSLSWTFTDESLTTISTSLSSTASCSFAWTNNTINNSGGSPYFYYYDGASAGSYTSVPLIEAYFMGFCGGDDEPTC